MKESKIMRGVVTTVAVIVFSIPAVASAKGSDELSGTSEKVSYADLNVQKEAGARQLYRRLQHASKRVCGVESLRITGSLSETSRAKACYKDSLNSAVAKINNAVLTEIHRG